MAHLNCRSRITHWQCLIACSRRNAIDTLGSVRMCVPGDLETNQISSCPSLFPIKISLHFCNRTLIATTGCCSLLTCTDMTAQLLMTCGLTDKRLPAFVLIRESTDTDGSFLISSILGQQLRASPQSKIVLVGVHHSYTHYQCVGMRIGYNLTQVCERGRLKVVDALKLIHEDALPLEDNQLVELIFQRIWKEVQDIPEAEDCCLILDDISMLRVISENDDLVIRFVEKLLLIQGTRTGHLSCVIKLNTYDIFPVLANNLDNRSSMTINIDSLKSGRFKEVDGRITITRPNQTEEKVVLYKVNDRNIKTFAKGFV